MVIGLESPGTLTVATTGACRTVSKTLDLMTSSGFVQPRNSVRRRTPIAISGASTYHFLFKKNSSPAVNSAADPAAITAKCSSTRASGVGMEAPSRSTLSGSPVSAEAAVVACEDARALYQAVWVDDEFVNVPCAALCETVV